MMLYCECPPEAKASDMKHTVKNLRVGSLTCWAIFVWAIAAEVDFLPRLGSIAWLRWQPSLVSGLFLWAIGDRLSELRCRCCGAEEVRLRGLFTRSRELLCMRCLRWNPAPGSPAHVPVTEKS